MPPVSVVTTGNSRETYTIGLQLARLLQPGDVVAISGELGAGKTVLCQGICMGLGYEGEVVSPSFVRMHSYSHVPPIWHIDFYLMQTASEGGLLGLEELYLEKGIVLIEWADKFPQLIPDESWWIHISWDSARELSRTLTIKHSTQSFGLSAPDGIEENSTTFTGK